METGIASSPDHDMLSQIAKTQAGYSPQDRLRQPDSAIHCSPSISAPVCLRKSVLASIACGAKSTAQAAAYFNVRRPGAVEVVRQQQCGVRQGCGEFRLVTVL
jgi:hypothetical protein